MEWALVTVAIVCGYLCGSIPFSYLVARTRGVDLRQVGSGNTGASNVWRTLGFQYFVAALALAACDGARIAAPAVAPDAGPAIRARRDPRPPALPTPPDGGPVGLVLRCTVCTTPTYLGPTRRSSTASCGSRLL